MTNSDRAALVAELREQKERLRRQINGPADLAFVGARMVTLLPDILAALTADDAGAEPTPVPYDDDDRAALVWLARQAIERGEQDRHFAGRILAILGRFEKGIPHRALTADDATREEGERARLRLNDLLRGILSDEPDDYAADAVTVLNVWRKEAATLLNSALLRGET